MSVEVGKQYRTPWEPSGVVEVLQIEDWGDDEPSAFIRFVGDHPNGYPSGSVGRYSVHELEGRDVAVEPLQGASS